MKIVKVNDNLKINIEIIYSLEKQTNQKEINEWMKLYNEYIKQYSEYPPELYIEEDRLFKPEFGAVNSKKDLEKYAKALDFYIVETIGEKPTYAESYYVILATGLKINIDKTIYDTINNCLNDYVIN